MNKTKILWTACTVFIILNAIMYLFPWGREIAMPVMGDIFPVICSLVSVILLWSAFRSFVRPDSARVAWLFLFIGIALFFMAEILYGYLELVLKTDMNSSFPTVADFFWCTGYIPLLAGLVMMFRGYKKSGLPMGNAKGYILMSAAYVPVFVAVIGFLLVPILQDFETDPLSRFFYLFYPIADVFIVIPAAELIYLTYLMGSGTIAVPWRILAIGFLFITIADLLFSYLSWLELYGNVNPMDILWNAGYLLIGIAAYYQKKLMDTLNPETTK